MTPGMTFSLPSPRLLAARRLQWTAVAVPVVALGASLSWVFGGAAIGIVVLVVLLAAGALAWVWLRRRCGAWGYLERDDDLIVRRGVLVRRLSVVPYGRMQFVDVTAGPVDRIFGLATVQLHTAAAATDARIPGLAQSEAQRLRDRLAALGEAQASGL